MDQSMLFDNQLLVPLVLVVAVLIIIGKAIVILPQNMAYIIERLGKYHETQTAGLQFIIPFIDRIAYRVSLKENAIDIPSQSAITKDNISLTIDGVLYIKVMEPYKASYGIDNYVYAVIQLAQTSMRSEIGKLDLDKTFEERDSLNAKIIDAINQASAAWGVQVMRYEIKDINPPSSVLDAMEKQMRAEREKRAAILDSEGKRQAAINLAEGEKQATVLAAEAEREQQVLKAQGEARSIELVAEAKAKALTMIGEAASTAQGQAAVQLDLATEAIAAKKAIARESTVVLMDNDKSSTGNTVAEALGVVAAIQQSGALNSALNK
ncbi:SPFH domain-containing protein [Rheinheimera sp.]|uniref:SPFH domain-containing protein n=1 Tax=Rheinheimera sp. TaxID=1869214 RepID=UPI003AF70C08